MTRPPTFAATTSRASQNRTGPLPAVPSVPAPATHPAVGMARCGGGGRRRGIRLVIGMELRRPRRENGWPGPRDPSGAAGRPSRRGSWPSARRVRRRSRSASVARRSDHGFRGSVDAPVSGSPRGRLPRQAGPPPGRKEEARRPAPRAARTSAPSRRERSLAVGGPEVVQHPRRHRDIARHQRGRSLIGVTEHPARC